VRHVSFWTVAGPTPATDNRVPLRDENNANEGAQQHEAKSTICVSVTGGGAIAALRAARCTCIRSCDHIWVKLAKSGDQQSRIARLCCMLDER